MMIEECVAILRPFRSISIISGRLAGDNESLEAICNGTPFSVEKISPRAGLELGSARSVDQRLTY